MQWEAGQSDAPAGDDTWGPTPTVTEPLDPPTRLAVPAKVLIFLLAVGMVVDVVSIVIEVDYYNLLTDLAHGVDVSFEEATVVDDRRGAIGLTQFAAAIATIIAFLVWFRRGYRNLASLGHRDLRYARGWAVGAWFVPILNLFRPKQIANDIWRGSAPVDDDAEKPGGEAGHWTRRPVAAIVHWWWAVHLVNTILGNVAGRLLFRAETLSEQRAASQLYLVTDALNIVSAIVAILFIRAVTRRQDALIPFRDPIVG